MKNQLFRDKSIERVTSPEQLNDYIRVANPSVWMMLGGIILILIGICAWGIFGRLDTLLSVGAVTDEGRTVLLVKESDIGEVTMDMVVRIDENEYQIAEISSEARHIDEEYPEYLLHVGGLTLGEWVYTVTLGETLGDDGSIYSADIVLENIAPISFVVN